MAGPHPVVSVAAELADGGRRSAHQADIAEHPEHEQEVLIAVEEGFHIGSQAFTILDCRSGELAGIGPDDGIPLGFGHAGPVPLQHLVRHVFHPFEEADGQAPVGQFLAAVHRPETVLEVIVLHAAVALDVAVAAVVVRQEQAFVGHEFAGAAAAEQDDGVLERSLVHAVNVFGGEPEAFGLHVADTLGNQGREPHPFVGHRRQGESDQGSQEQYGLFHGNKFLVFTKIRISRGIPKAIAEADIRAGQGRPGFRPDVCNRRTGRRVGRRRWRWLRSYGP